MKKEKNSLDSLEALYEKKIAILTELGANLKRQLEILNFGDGEGAAKLSFQNEKFLQTLNIIDEKISNIGENSPQNSKLIFLSEKIFSLSDETRNVHSKVSILFERSLGALKKELNEFQVKRQVQKYLRNRDMIWKNPTC